MNAPAAVTEGWPLHARFDGPIVMIGFGSIGKGTLPLIERHIAFDRSKFVVIAPEDSDRGLLDERQIQFIHQALTKENYRELLTPLLTAGPGRGMFVNLSVDTSSVALMELCKDLDAFYIDTVVEPWPGLYTDRNRSISERSNYALRESVLDLRRRRPGGITAVSCCGANPGMVSWMVKQALVDIAGELKLDFAEPQSREDWGRLMQRAGVKGIHIAERDTQRARDPKPKGKFVNTWSVEGFISEGMQPSELGWGTHEKTLPPGGSAPRLRLRRRDLPQAAGRRHAGALVDADGAGAARLPGDPQRVRSRSPTTSRCARAAKVVYRPTCHYAYHPCDDAVLSLHEMAGAQWKPQQTWHILSEDDIVDGIDELGVLLYGHAKNAYWYGSQLSIEETRRLAPYQNATGLQVTSAVLAGIVWMLENPERGIVEADEMDFRRCLELQRPYLGPVVGRYTDWTPLDRRGELFPENLDTSDPWQFTNVLVS